MGLKEEQELPQGQRKEGHPGWGSGHKCKSMGRSVDSGVAGMQWQAGEAGLTPGRDKTSSSRSPSQNCAFQELKCLRVKGNTC